jgi:hypothetical protein
MANKYCKIEDVKAYLDISQDIDDQLLEDIIERATKMIETHTHRTFYCAAPTSRFFDADEVQDNYKRLWLRSDACEIAYVKNGDGTTIAASQYQTLPLHHTPAFAVQIKRYVDTVFEWTTNPEGAIEVNAYWAFSKTPPLDIVHACVRLSTFLYRQKDNTSDIERPILTGDGSTVMPIRLPKDIQEMLKSYIAEVF